MSSSRILAASPQGITELWQWHQRPTEECDLVNNISTWRGHTLLHRHI